VATKVLTNAQIVMGGYNLSSDFNQITLTETFDMLDATTFGQTNRIYKAGLSRIRMTGGGFVQDGSGLVGTVLYNDVGIEDEVVSVWPDTITEGVFTGGGYAFKAVAARYTPLAGGVGELLKFTVEAESRGVV